MAQQKDILAWNRQKVREMRKAASEEVPQATFQSSLWSKEENRLYMAFLIKNEEWFLGSKQVKREVRIYVLMS